MTYPLAQKLNIFRQMFSYNFSHPKFARQYEAPFSAEASFTDCLQMYDIAVDLRRQSDTRFLLAQIPARLKVGYQSFSEYDQKLDICLPAEKDEHQGLKTKNLTNSSRQMLKLIDSIPLETFRLPNLIDSPPPRLEVALFPCPGYPLKEWPLAHFTKLTQLILENRTATQVNLFLSEAEAERTHPFKEIRQAEVLIGLGVDELADALAKNALVVSNNSFGGYFASLPRIPVIGISGGQDTVLQWQSPFGFAKIVYSDVSCSSCYLLKIEDCPHDLVCLKQISPESIFAFAKERMEDPPGMGISTISIFITPRGRHSSLLAGRSLSFWENYSAPAGIRMQLAS
jgi:ADP-heptose:LPS heptosyltransferase